MAAPKFADDISFYLINTVGLATATVGFLASNPINQYAVIEYQGPLNIKVHGTQPGVALDEGNFQVLARHAAAATALTNIMTVVDALDGLRDVTIQGTVYTYISMKGRPRILERLEDGSCLYIAEFFCQSRR